MNTDALATQLKVARNLLLGENLKTAVECLAYLLPMKEGFEDLILYFKMVLVFPVTSASCERSFSALRRIKSYFRSSMGQTRTSALALLSIERDLPERLLEETDSIIYEFAQRGDRRMNFVV